MFYNKILRPILFKTNPEKIHNLAVFGLAFFSRFNFVYKFIKKFCEINNSVLQIKIGIMVLNNPVGLAAGFDKDIDAPYAYSMLGFGFTEFGSITFSAQDGNAKPRLWRLQKDKSLIVNYGLNNNGVARAVKKIEKLEKHVGVFGISIAPTSNLPLEKLTEDYLNSFKKLYNKVNYIVFNISCPNVEKCESVQKLSFVKELLTAVKDFRQKNNIKTDIFIKISSEMSETELDELIKLSLDNNITGIIATNLVKDRENLPKHKSSDKCLKHAGGISGKLLQTRSDNTIKYIYKKTNGQLPIIGVGGVFNAKDAYQKIKNGASAIQLITGFIYGGPLTVQNINKGLIKLLHKDGFTELKQAIGVDSR